MDPSSPTWAGPYGVVVLLLLWEGGFESSRPRRRGDDEVFQHSKSLSDPSDVKGDSYFMHGQSRSPLVHLQNMTGRKRGGEGNEWWGFEGFIWRFNGLTRSYMA